MHTQSVGFLPESSNPFHSDCTTSSASPDLWVLSKTGHEATPWPDTNTSIHVTSQELQQLRAPEAKPQPAHYPAGTQPSSSK